MYGLVKDQASLPSSSCPPCAATEDVISALSGPSFLPGTYAVQAPGVLFPSSRAERAAHPRPRMTRWLLDDILSSLEGRATPRPPHPHSTSPARTLPCFPPYPSTRVTLHVSSTSMPITPSATTCSTRGASPTASSGIRNLRVDSVTLRFRAPTWGRGRRGQQRRTGAVSEQGEVSETPRPKAYLTLPLLDAPMPRATSAASPRY